MSETVFIKKRDRKKVEGGFDALRHEGLKVAQQLSGKIWTDYNLHDPGVTILEQVIYALTELNYRAGFDVEDYLVDEQGNLDYQQQALFSPEEAFPCRPTTEVDYRKAILNAISEVENVWLIPSEQSDAGQGLNRIAIKLRQGLSEADSQKVRAQVENFYHAQRNLCEDIEGVYIVNGQDYALCAEVEVSSHHRGRPVDIMANIYFECSQRIAGGISLYSYDQLLKEGSSLDELFTGPFTEHGRYKDEEFCGNQTEFSVTSLYSSINSLEGVDHVKEVYLEHGGEKLYDVIKSDGPETTFNLLIPGEKNPIKVVLTANGRVFSVSEDDLRAKFDELSFRHYSARIRTPDMQQVYRLPKGTPRPLAAYASIQEQFPVEYGIGAFGIPDSESAAVKARAKQLKSYLLLFEQVMANYLANLASIRSLFSVDEKSDSSYTVAVLNEKQISGLDEFYPDKPKEVLETILEQFDDNNERKSRLLDYQLALYGETFSQNSLRHFNYYYSQSEMAQIIVNNKIEYLRTVIELGRDRGGAADYTGDLWVTWGHSGLQQRVSILLGFKNRTARALSMAILKQGLKFARHHVYEQLKAGSPELEFIDATRLEQAGFEEVPGLKAQEPYSIAGIRRPIEECIPLKNSLLSDFLLRHGIYLSKYRLGSLTSDQNYQLTFQTDDERYWYLGTYEEKQKGINAANALRKFLIQLNIESEGLHIVEHLLLRPQGKAHHSGIKLPADDDFYSFRVSVIFPAWTARCDNKQFRMLAEETVLMNAPAHVYPEFYWLDFHKMYEFELLYEAWMRLKSQSPSAPETLEELNQAASVLISFLINNRMSGEAEESS